VKTLLRTSVSLLCVLISSVTIGCATLVTTTKESSEQPNSAGVTYYLPMKLVKVTLTRKAVPIDALKVAAADLEKAKVAAQEAANRKQTSKAAAEWADKSAQAAESAKPGTPMAIKARENADLLVADLAAADKIMIEANKKQASTQLAYDNLVASGNVNKYEDEILITELPAIPDPNERYVANLSHWPTHADILKISTTEAGLLKTVSGTSTDKTGAILEDTAKAIIAGIKASVGLPGTPQPSNYSNAADPCKTVTSFLTQPFTNEYTFNPSNPSEKSNINCTLKKVGSHFQITANKVPAPPNVQKSQSTPNSNQCGQCFTGLVYRRPVRWEISISKTETGSNGDVPIRTVTILLPNEGPAMVAPMDTSPFIATSYDIAFQDGMLTKWEVDRPSELYAAIQIPLNILKDVIALPTQLIQLKFDYSSKDAELLKAEKTRVEAAAALREAIESSSDKAGTSTNTTQ
jgi:hypothetical protein